MGILSLIPIKDWIYCGIFAVAAIAVSIGWHEHNVTEQKLGAQKVEEAVKAANDKAAADNAAANKRIEADHAERVATIEDNYEHMLQASDVSVAALNARLRQLTTASVGNQTAVPGNAATQTGPNDPTRISPSLAAAIEGVVTAGSHDADKVVALQNYVRDVCLR